MTEERVGPADDTDALTGVFLFRVPEEAWWWSDDMCRLLGYDSDETPADDAMLDRHVHPDDREGIRRVWDRGLRTGTPFSTYYRLLTRDGQERHAVLVGDGRVDDDSVVVLRGFVVDVTEPVQRHAQESADVDIARARASQEDVDVARGVLMALYGVHEDVAFRVLRRHSQQTNVKLRTVARAVVEATPTPPGEGQHDLHLRIAQALYPED
ncbi:ANTAR domain-containing protein [Streptomyces adustus]|uniref:ANTAR domain-containing protein n=1 Tax=Streptomyces adustus TaxID=1609272 RepID=A0A5N8VEN2_9ACTN|nr:ANTAR domain-containing protein [Streptomyces adustus]